MVWAKRILTQTQNRGNVFSVILPTTGLIFLTMTGREPTWEFESQNPTLVNDDVEEFVFVISINVQRAH
jgi:hypothetical protein